MHSTAVGCFVKLNKPFVVTVLLSALALCSCQHDLPGGTTGGGSTATVSFTMVADTPPSNLGIISFLVTPSTITLTSSTGAQTTLKINGSSGFTFDLARLQSDSAFLGTATKVPQGSITSIAVTFLSAKLAFFNGTGTALTNPSCPSGNICVASFAGPFTATITATQSISGNTGFGIDVNLANALTVSGSTLMLNLSNSGTSPVVSDFALPRGGASSNLSSGQLDLIEDYTGIVTLTNTSVTITPASVVNRAAITASSSSTTIYDEDPTQTLCPIGTTTLSGCVGPNSSATMDAILNSDGTFTVQEIEPIQTTVQDTVEGVVVSVPSATQFVMVVTDIIPAATSSKIGNLNVGDELTVNLPTAGGTVLQADTKGLAVGAALTNFTGASGTSGIRMGQEASIYVSSFTAASGTTPAISNNTGTVTLRWSRLTASPTGVLSSTLINLTGLPGYFGVSSASVFSVQIFPGTQGQGTRGVTNLDGITSTANLNANNPAAVRALYVEDAGNTLNPAFFAAKVRQH